MIDDRFVDNFEELPEQTRTILHAFLSSTEHKLLLPGLGVWQRKQVHLWAAQNNLTSTSLDMPTGRVVSITSVHANPPPAFICPIAQTIMVDPVLTQDGFTYERTSIETWLHSHHKSPMTNLPLTSRALIANIALRQAIEEWKT